ncbi:hypothetical protein ABFU49_20305 [Xanthomonas campestris pv. campestris]|uniref:VgrG-related protein n=1 Tax=Xanthomonas campestris TaxID=339 RepID=UPI00388DAEA6
MGSSSDAVDQTILSAVQDYKAEHVKGLFPRVEKQKTLDSLKDRAENEKADLIKLADPDKTVAKASQEPAAHDRSQLEKHGAHSVDSRP